MFMDIYLYLYRTSGAVGIPILSEREYHYLFILNYQLTHSVNVRYSNK